MCYSPVTIKTPQGYKTVPCHHCLECLRKYQSDWSNRMYEELKSHGGKAVFFTLTYDENNVPKNYVYDYQVFRSPSDYGYSNVYTDEKGREKVLPCCKGERKHRAVSPLLELEAAGVDTTSVIDFNIKRNNHEKFIEQIQKIYGDYLRSLYVVSTDNEDTVKGSLVSDWSSYDFDAVENDFLILDNDGEVALALDNAQKLLNDDVYPFEDAFHNVTFRERPIMALNSVRKKDVQDWIKRARQRRVRRAKKEGTPLQEFTFFITSEYGPRTLRPHYHGVLFGVTAEETIDMCKDWQRHHGERISWDNVDLSKGDMSYCSKYCSKGFYEHPLCSRDFFYFKPLKAGEEEVSPFTEYHSKHYERCIEIFGMDEPIVDPTFHLVSKGLGIQWCEDNAYMMDDFRDINFKDDTAYDFVRIVAPWDKDYDEILKNGDFTEDCGYLCIKEKKIFNENGKDYNECIERFFNRFKYRRVFKDEVVSYGVPKYYRAKMLSEGLRVAFAAYVQQVNVELYREKLSALESEYRVGEGDEVRDIDVASILEKQLREERCQRMRDCRRKTIKKLEKSKL